VQKEVEEAREEANDNVRFLATLTQRIGVITGDSMDFESMDQHFDGVLHTILLIWRYSKYYNTPTRMAVLIREICNTVISKATNFISGPDIFGMIASEDSAECYDKLDRTLQICTAFKDTYVLYRDIAAAQGGDGWKMKNDALFVRLDAFRERCRDALDFTRTVMQFLKLERIDIGGTKGKLLSQCVQTILEEFNAAVETFKAVEYDIMVVEEKKFDQDFFIFRQRVKDLDRRLGSLLAEAFDDLDTIDMRLKLFDNFEGLLERPIIQAELEKKHKILLQSYREDLTIVERTFVDNKHKVDNLFDDAPIYSNLPPAAGAIYWARSLKRRIEEPMSKIVLYNQTLKSVPEEFKEVDKTYLNLKKLLEEYERNRYNSWESDVETAKEKLRLRLLRRQEKTGLLKVNFDPALTRLLREVRFFLVFDIQVPQAAMDMFERFDTYREWVGQLEQIVQMYNSVLTELLPVEEPLLEERITKMDQVLSPGLTDLKWKSEDKIPEFIETTMRIVSDVSGVVDVIKTNLKSISRILSEWCREPLIERKKGAKPMAMEDFDTKHKERVGMRMMSMTDGGKDIHKFVKDSSEALKVSKVASTWKAYVDFVNNIVIEGFVSSIAVSLQYLCEILDPLIIAKHEMLPFFDVKIELSGSEIIFDPPFTSSTSGVVSLRQTIDGWLKDFFATVTCMPRLDMSCGDYLSEIREHFQMQCLLALFSELIDNTEFKCMEYRDTFMQHSYLWMDNIDKSFARFLEQSAHDLVEGFEEDGMKFRSIMDRIKVDIGPAIPVLDEFDRQITKFNHMKQDLANMKTPVDIHWLRINAQPVKIALVGFARQWEEKYSEFIKNFTESRISTLVEFIEKLKVGLGPPSPIDNPENERLLYATMTHVADVKLANNAVKMLFQPIRDLCQLLKKHHMAHEGLVELEKAPSQWEEVIRIAWDEKEKMLPLQNEEMLKIRVKIEKFAEEVAGFRSEFLQKCPFGTENAVSGEFDLSYQALDDYYNQVQEIHAKAADYNDLEILFDMAMSNYRALTDCTSDLVLLKNLWDGVVLVHGTFVDWNEIKWDEIDTEALVSKVREIQVQVKNMPKGLRGFKLYKWLEGEVKNMSTALPLINDLHSETMRDRHWTALMTAAKTTFERGPEFCFKNLLDLELHHFADDVSEIVDQSVKEAKIEKKLGIIRNVWSKMQVAWDTATNPECPLLGELGEVLERLDGDSLEMMGMTSQGRFIEFCKPVVDEWGSKLRAIDGTLGVWQKVQLNWCRLEPIFMQSDDIRSQLPEDSKRFEQLDNQFKDLMMEASNSQLIVEICCQEGREDALKKICNDIETCEKSLNEYLEQKKKAFPRFYFCANQALLDILSNGNRPLKVAEYLGDIFDGVQTLDFSKAPDTGKIACGQKAKDGEKVPWAVDLPLDGAVELYLSNLEEHFRVMLRDSTELSRAAADSWETDKPREFWLDEFPSQVALVITQIMWTEETTRAFEEIESGSENAMKEYKRVNDDRIEKLIKRVQAPLSRETRTKIIIIITIDVHSRDVVEGFVTNKITDATDFKWTSQLRFYWQMCPGPHLVSYTPETQKTVVIKICDWVTIYCFEYVGNQGRLVITPLTDRCYITLTQAMNLILGGAPAGPAGTGKTETTKDLSRAMALQIVVFNCSDQMTYQTMAQIFMGIAQTGCWGCFDEFNRISIEVLSVVSTQYKTILDAIRGGVPSFTFMDEDCKLISTCGAFITMNPGYAGRTELPENLKALFRSVAMIVPDLKFICENMLMSEGFIKARPLANKFVQLYSLCKELLSKQMHYDWGLRAVKSLLRQAGELKRMEPDSDENPVLCRALRDFNTPKITTMDMPIFLRLIQDLFPRVWPDPFEDPDFEKTATEVSKVRGLQPDSSFISKILSLISILGVRHCCFIIGPTGCGKTETWKTLLDCCRQRGEDGMWEQANPKAVTSDELYGIMTKTKEWKDGLIAVIMRNMSKEMNGYKSTHVHKWVILDGDIDATWIESMNTVMDDNKILTLVSNERIPFTPTMRMLLEIQDMKHASPATVSRGGVLFINETDIGWKPYVESWREKMDQVAYNAFYMLFSNYFEANIDSMRKSFVFSCPILDMCFIQSITCFIDALLNNNTKDNMEAMKIMSTEDLKNSYDAFFAYAVMWSIGGAVADDKTVNHRKSFNSLMRSLSKAVKFPDVGDPIEYRYEPKMKEWVHWDQWVVPYNPICDKMFQNIVISNVDLERMKYVLDLHMMRNKPVLYVGVAGTSKTVIVKDYLADMQAKSDDMTSQNINNNNYTTSYALQAILMGCLDKRSGRTFGPPANKKCVFFIDDLNMPYVDTYDTQSGIMLLTQIMSYAQLYNREALDEKRELVDIKFCACMNPKAGSFMINNRLQRHFTVLTCFTPTASLISGIYQTILEKHLAAFSPSVQKLAEGIVNATVDTLIGGAGILNTPCFLPSAAKFHYQFNLKDVGNIFQGLLNTSPAMYKEACKYCRVWVHEALRVWSDRLVNNSDANELMGILEKVTSKHFTGISKDDLFAPPLLMTSFISQAGGNERMYLPVKDMPQLKKVCEDKLTEYNEQFAAMALVLFEDAICHVCRIARITDNPCGNALLVGVGGSGKQSLANLATFCNGQDLLRILVNQSYGMADLKLDLMEFYKKAAVKPGLPQAFLMTDGQIADERFLVYINDMLSSGAIPDLFAREEYDAIFGAIRNSAKAAGYTDDRDGLFGFFIDKVRKNLHYILCHSPVGDDFRIRGRKFPALISCSVVDEFMAWPRDALEGVARVNLIELVTSGNIPEQEMMESVGASMSETHLSIDYANKRFLLEERRNNYTTPKSFLELISFYKKMLVVRQTDVTNNSERLERGLTIMEQVQEKVAGLKEDLKIMMVQVEEKKTATAVLIEQVTKAFAHAEEEKHKANEEEAKTTVVASAAATLQAEADGELSEAKPAMEAAAAAVDCLEKPSIQELKALGKPPPECAEVCAACAYLLYNVKKKMDWKGAQKMMSNPGGFIDEVKGFSGKEIPDATLKDVDALIAQPFFNFDVMKGKSTAAAYLAGWVVNIVIFYKIYVKVAPLMAKVEQATKEKDEALAALAIVKQQVAEIEEECAKLDAKLQGAKDLLEATEAQAAKCLDKLSLAERLVNGLADEYKRWTQTVAELKVLGIRLIGNSLLASAFVGYISPFSSKLRKELWQTMWTTDITERKIPMSEAIDPLKVLSTDADVANWQNEGLPSDRVSVENAAVITSCSRWPLMIDPQLQGVKWIKQRIGEDLTVLQFTMNNWLQKVIFCIQMGGQLMLEAVGAEIDAILDPVLSRAVIKRGRTACIIKIGGEEIDYDPKFQLFLQSKLPNPHYRPEIAAQCTIINFIVTPEGLEDQILAMVVNVEKPELEQQKQELVRKQNDFKVTLAQLEDDLLSQLAAADPATILDNLPLIEGLEKTKATSKEIAIQVQEAQKTETEINTSRELYRAVAAEGSMLFFLIIQLCFIEHMYQYSLDSFVTFLYKAIERTEPCEDTHERTTKLIVMIRITIFRWVNRGLFEAHKLILCSLLAFKLFSKGMLAEDFHTGYFNYLMRGPCAVGMENPLVEWLPNKVWGMVVKLTELENFEQFAGNMEKDAPSRFKEWFNELTPEEVKLPLDWKKLDQVPFQKLLVIRALRPDRMNGALGEWIRQQLPDGREYMDCDASSSFQFILTSTYEDSTTTTPIYFILSPGADPVKEVEAMGKKVVPTFAQCYHNVAMGQGQDVVAMAKLDIAHREGHWVMLQNVHLMPKWCIELEKKLDVFAIENSHPNFRLFLSSDPNKGIPIGILERSIKLTNEPPEGMLANLRRSFALFSKEDFEDRDAKVKAILFALCHFHSLMLERKKFGPLGYNMNYPFAAGDLRDSAQVLYNYLEGSSSVKIPWDDLRYIFGEIMYGGHIVDDWDRRMCEKYLFYFMRDELLDEIEMIPYADGRLCWPSPQPGPHEKYVEHIETMPAESPLFFGMHPNAEINFRTVQCEKVFDILMSLVGDGGAGDEGDGDAGQSPMAVAEGMAAEILEEVQEKKFPTDDVSRSMSDEEKGPYQFVFIQECDYMNGLVYEMVRGLAELMLGFKGELTMSEQMEGLAMCLYTEKLPKWWVMLGFPSTRPLRSWRANLQDRCMQLDDWIGDPLNIPKVTDVARLFNPQSFLTAIKQICCQTQGLELDKLQVYTDVTKKEPKQVDSHAKEGAFVQGMFLEGARWDMASNSMEDSKPKEMAVAMPVIICKAGPMMGDKADKNSYICPTYCVPIRRPYFVFPAQLRTKANPDKWVLAGVAMILDMAI
jgi:dynein heavy chain